MFNTHTANNLKSRRGLQRMLCGGLIGLLLIGWFLLSAGAPDPSWSSYWRIRPLVLVPLAGAAGGLAFHLIQGWGSSGWKKGLALLVGLLAFLAALWVGTVLGLDGTYWH